MCIRDRYMALRGLWKKKRWDAANFGKVLAAYVGETDDEKPLSKVKVGLDSLRAFLDEHGLRYTDGGLSYLLSFAGVGDLERAKSKGVSIEALKEAMGKIHEVPLYMTLLPPEKLDTSPVARFQRGYKKVVATNAFASDGPSAAAAPVAPDDAPA